MNEYDKFVAPIFGTPQRRVEAPGAPIVGARPQQVNEYDAVYEDLITRATRQQVLGSMHQAVQTNPDDMAEAYRLSRRYPAPAQVLYRNLKDVRLQAAVDEADARLFNTNLPVLQRKMADPVFAAQARDDIEPLAALEGTLGFFRSLPAGGLKSIQTAMSGAATALDIGARALDAPVRLIFGDEVANAFWFDLGDTWNQALNPAQSLRTAGQGYKGLAELFAVDAAKKNFASDVGEGVGQLATQIAAMIATGGAGATALFTAQGVEAMRQKTADDPAAQALKDTANLVGGLVTGGLERIGIDRLMNSLPPQVKNTVLRWVADKAAAAGTEAAQEITEALLQDVVRIAITNPEAGIEIADALYEGGVAGTAAALVRAALGVRRRQGEVAAHAEGLENLQKAMQQAGQSLLRERNPDAFREALQEMADAPGGAPASIYVDAAVLNQLTPEQVAQYLPSALGQLEQATIANGQVELPIGEVLANTPGSEIEKLLMENARLTPTGESMADVKAAGAQAAQFLQSEFERVVAQAQDQQVLLQQADDIKARVLDNLNATKRFSKDVNEAYATFVQSFYVATSARLGMTPAEMFDRYPLRVVAENPAQPGEVLKTGRPGRLDAIEAFHYSPQDLPAVSTAMFGRGLQGSGREEYMAAEDKRLAKRSYFYVDKGTGITPEAGVGGRGHRALLNNIYDANADPLRLKQGRGKLGFESAVLDAGFAGYLDRLSGTQPGQVILLGDQVTPVEQLGPLGATTGRVVPQPASTAGIGRDVFVDALRADASLPAGQLTRQRWSEVLRRQSPAVHAALAEAGVFDDGPPVYKDELVRDYIARTPAPVYEQRAEGDTRYRERAAELLGKITPPKRSAVGLMRGEVKHPIFKNLFQLSKWFTERNRRGMEDMTDPAVKKRMLDALYADTLMALTDAGSAVGWYDAKVKAALDIMAEVHPEIATDQQARFGFITILAITSNQTRVNENFALADALYTSWKETGVWPTDVGAVMETRAKTEMSRGLAKLGQLVQQHGWQRVHQVMTSKMLARDIEAFTGVPVSGEGKDSLVYGATFLGPKIGAFFNNLYGNFDTVTMDRWFMRTINRVRGSMLELPANMPEMLGKLASQLDAGVDTFGVPADLIRADIARYQALTDEQRADVLAVLDALPNLAEYAKSRHKVFAKGEIVDGKPRSYVNRNAENQLAKNLDLALHGDSQTPRGAADRELMRELVFKLQRKLQSDGIDMVVADIQAALWYYEKDLKDKLQGKAPEQLFDAVQEAEDYETAARRVLAARRGELDAGPAGSAGPARAGGQRAVETRVDTTGDLFAQRAAAPGQATLDDFTPAGLPGLLEKDGWAILTAEDPNATKAPPEQNAAAMAALQQDLRAMGAEFVQVVGKYGDVQNSLIVLGISEQEAVQLGRKYGQESILTRKGLIYSADGSITPATGVNVFAAPPEDFYTEVPTFNSYFSLDLDFDAPLGIGVQMDQRIRADFDAAVREYEAVGDTVGGTVLNTDLARELSPEYRADRSRSAEVHEPASNFIKRLYARKLAAPTPEGKRPVVLFTGGGTGAGKSTGLKLPKLAPVVAEAEIVYDTNMNKFESADQKIQQALEAGREVAIVYTFRDPVEALAAGALPRAMRMGRTVPLREHIRTHVGAWEVINALQAKYAGDERVHIEVVDNSRGRGKAAVVPLQELQPRVYNDLEGVLRETLEAERAAGRISETVYRGFAGEGPAQGVGRQGGQGDRQGTEQGGQQDLTAWFGADSTFAFTPLFHGTSKKAAEALRDGAPFKRSKTGAQGPGVYLGDAPESTSAYTDGARLRVYARGRYLTNMQWTDYVQKHGWDGAEAAAKADGWAGIHDTMFEDAVVVWDPADIRLAEDGPGSPESFFQGPRGTFSPSRLEIALLEKADLSTFLHESGHFFLEVLADIASQPGAPADVVRDMETTLAWFGVTDLYEWNTRTLDQKRKHHERWAEAFEQYLLEGRAPSMELRPVFGRFRAWLVQVYKSLKAFMAGRNLKLSDDVRQVFDRLLATEEQIAEVELQEGFEAIYGDPADAGMTPKEWAAYQDTRRQATEGAIAELQTRSVRDLKWATGAFSRELKRLQDEAASLRSRVRDEVAAEVNATPVEKARAYIEQTRTSTPEQRAELKAWRERRDAERAKLAEQVKAARLASPEAEGLKGIAKGQFLARNKRLMANEVDRLLIEWEQANPRPVPKLPDVDMDVIAEMFGFSSGDHLRREMLETPTAKDLTEAITDQRMLEEHGDVVTPEAMKRAALEAVHNEARARSVATELAALERSAKGTEKTATGGRVNILNRAAKSFAENVIARRKVRDLRPSVWQAAARRAARAVQQALAAGKTAEAAAAKRDQLLNFHTTSMALKAQAEVAKAVEYLRKFEKEGVRKALATDYVDQIDKLLERFDLRQVSNRQLDRRAALLSWVEAQREQGIEPDIPPVLLDEAQRLSYRDLTVEEFRGLVDTVRQIEHLGRLKEKLLTAKDNRDFAAVRDGVVAAIVDNAGDRQADTRTPNTVLGSALVGLKKFWSAHIKAATLARVMDGGKEGGPVWNAIIRGANEAGDNEIRMREQATKQLHALLRPVLKEGKLGGKGLFIPAVNRSMNREARLAVALNTGNDGNLQRLMGGEGWTEQQVQAILDTLSTSDWAFVQSVWDYFETYRPLIGAKERRVMGKEPDWVEPTPREVRTADGQVMQLRGGYYPIKYDPRASEKAEAHADAEDAARQLRAAYTSATTRRSFTKQRAEEVVDRPLLYSLDGIYNGLQEVIHDLSWHEWLIDTNRLLRDKKVSAAIREKYGPEAHQQFKKWVEDVAVGERAAQNSGEVALGWLRQGVSISGLGFNVMTAAIQPLGLTQSIVRVGPQYIARGIARFIGSPLSSVDEINEMSTFMRTRNMTRLRELAEVRAQVKGQTGARRAIDAGAYWLMLRTQQLVDVPTWWGAYEKAVADGAGDDKAVALADQAVIDAQGSGMQKDLSAIERGNAALKLFTVFYTFFNTAFNLGVGQTMLANTPAKKAKLAADYLLLFTAPAILAWALKNALTPGDSGDDEDEEKLMRALAGEQLAYIAGLMFGVREIGNPLAQQVKGEAVGTDYSGPAGLRLLNDLTRLTKQAGQGEMDDGLRKAIVNFVGTLARLPSAQINRSINGTQALADGKTDNPLAIIFGYQEPR